MVHSLFLESCASVELASRLLFIVLTVCVNHEAKSNGAKRPRGEETCLFTTNVEVTSEAHGSIRSRRMKKQGPIAAFDSYVLIAVCALACELQLFPFISRASNLSSSGGAQPLAKSSKINGSACDVKGSIDSAVHHTHRILSILVALFSLEPSSIGTSWSYSSNEIVAAAMVAAHLSELFRRSKACMHALSVLVRCEWGKKIHGKASSLYNLIDLHSKTVASIVNKVEPLEAHFHVPPWKDSFAYPNGRKPWKSSRTEFSDSGPSVSHSKESVHTDANHRSEKASHSPESSKSTLTKSMVGFPFDASDLANFLTMDRQVGFNCSAQGFLRSMLAEKQELCFSVVSLLWHKLLAAPETQLIAESTSAQQGRRQAERELQPWIAKDDDQGQKLWRINQRIVKLIVELMRNHDTPESLILLASASDLLLRATDGVLVLYFTSARAIGSHS